MRLAAALSHERIAAAMGHPLSELPRFRSGQPAQPITNASFQTYYAASSFRNVRFGRFMRHDVTSSHEILGADVRQVVFPFAGLRPTRLKILAAEVHRRLDGK